MKIETKLMTISPEQAAAWLGKYNHRNRNLREEQALMFAEDMKSGKWKLTHQGIAFYEDGVIADGQHRLAAIVKAKMPIKFFVTTGLPKEVGSAIDQSRPRQVHDAIKIGGQANWVDRNVVAVVRFILSDLGTDVKSKSVNEILDYSIRHRTLLEKTMKMVIQKKRYVTHSGIVACYFAALHAKENQEKVARFAQVMYYGEIAGSHENAAIKLREHLINNPRSWIGLGKTETCKRAMRAIQAFCAGESLGALRMPSDYIYPIPR